MRQRHGCESFGDSMRRRPARRLYALAGLVIAVLVVPAASASEIATRNAGPTVLLVGGSSAMIQWGGRSLLVANAVDARSYSASIPQIHFQKIYNHALQGGSCRRVYPKLWNLDKACQADDGSIWATQRWQRLIPDYGGTSAAEELEISHYTTLPEFANVHWQTKYNLPVLCGRAPFQRSRCVRRRIR